MPGNWLGRIFVPGAGQDFGLCCFRSRPSFPGHVNLLWRVGEDGWEDIVSLQIFGDILKGSAVSHLTNAFWFARVYFSG